MRITKEELRLIIIEELEDVVSENNIFDNIRKKKEYCKKNPSAAKCQKEDRPSPENWKKATKKESLDEEELEEKKKKPCKPSKGKRFAKRVNGKCRSFGQKGKAKDGGDRIRPGTKKGDAYCARSAKIKKQDRWQRRSRKLHSRRFAIASTIINIIVTIVTGPSGVAAPGSQCRLLLSEGGEPALDQGAADEDLEHGGRADPPGGQRRRGRHGLLGTTLGR